MRLARQAGPAPGPGAASTRRGNRETLSPL